jgi:hypothetical protein
MPRTMPPQDSLAVCLLFIALLAVRLPSTCAARYAKNMVVTIMEPFSGQVLSESNDVRISFTVEADQVKRGEGGEGKKPKRK